MPGLGDHWYRGWHITDDYPDILSLEDLIEASDLAELLKVSRGWVLEAREGDSNMNLYGLPYLRIGSRTYFSKNQVTWWLNQYQRKVQDRRGPWAANPFGSKGSPMKVTSKRALDPTQGPSK